MDNKQSLAADATSQASQPIQTQLGTAQAAGMPPQPQTVTSPPPNINQPKQSKALIIVLLVGFLITVALVGGAYIFVNNNNKSTQTQIETPVAADLESDLNQINVEDLEDEFSTVEADLQNL